MKKFISMLTIGLCLGLGSAKAVIISSNTSSAGALPALYVFPRESITYELTGNYTGFIQLEASLDGVNYVSTGITATSSGTLKGVTYNGNYNAYFRWNVLSRSAGYFNTVLRDNDDFTKEEYGNKRTSVLKYYDSSVRLPQMFAYEPSGTIEFSSYTAINPDVFKNVFNVITSTGGQFTLSAIPTISTTPYSDGTVYIIQSATNTITFTDNGTLSGTLLELGSTIRALGVGDILVLIYRAGKWWEMGFYNN